MTNHDQENHWDLLASELGTEIPSRDTSREESEAPRQQPETYEGPREPDSAQPQPPPAAAKRPTPRPPARPAPMGGDWDDLASQLGVVRPEQPDKPVQPESGRKQRDVEREWERPSTDTVREDEGAAKAPETVVTTSTWDETAGAEASSDSADVDSSSAVEEEQKGEKTKRRRRRRPAKKKDAGREAATADKPPSEGQPADAESTEDEKKAGATKKAPKQAEAAEAAKPAGSAHRGIPNWQEAIEMIISKNMESRAKKPSGSPASRSRAGSRGGRKTKPAPKKAV